jgi:hypothetical protein
MAYDVGKEEVGPDRSMVGRCSIAKSEKAGVDRLYPDATPEAVDRDVAVVLVASGWRTRVGMPDHDGIAHLEVTEKLPNPSMPDILVEIPAENNNIAFGLPFANGVRQVQK